VTSAFAFVAANHHPDHDTIASFRRENASAIAESFLQVLAQIRIERNDCYKALERTQRGTLDVTSWLAWFLGCLGRAIDGAEDILSGVLRKARFWEAHGTAPLNERQRMMVNRLLDGFEGKLTSSKWAKLAKCSQDTALRDINDLIERGILRRDEAGGRSRRTKHQLSFVCIGRQRKALNSKQTR
jgi:Fic family protein